MAHEDVYLGLSGIDLDGRSFELGEGISLTPAYAHLFSTDVMAFERPRTPGTFHPGPWHATSRKPGRDVSACLFIPRSLEVGQLPPLATGMTVISLLRLWVDPAVCLEVMTRVPLHTYQNAAADKVGGAQVAMLFSTYERHVRIGLAEADGYLERFDWVIDHWRAAAELRASKAEFELAIQTFDNAQCIPNTAMMLVSLWGAIEAIFSPHKAELVFRASAQLAAYLEPRGSKRLELQRKIAKMYGLRSAAAHGAPKHAAEDVVETYSLLRMAIIRMIERREVPSKERLEELLFT
ncbi:HEPN domain-containing protein [Xanthomonas arboricola pv. corylina]|uniref:HEPN domain-containing protein n=1 Tax=Xanthomonas arboricola TaxID=56448 RepID=UPI0025B13549|nr:HEPN domain-containing protein [Xanthomonas arboricola]MDN0205318.1 HEPN domain-containing protein [Xanthomonas arboricola pv. corylina]MDN0215398.1 HEPN domain-containing protein [Xanthomonas arboricola pv. corylina]